MYVLYIINIYMYIYIYPIFQHLRSTSPPTTTTSTTSTTSTTPEEQTYVDEANLEHLIKNNKKWVSEMSTKDPTFFEKLGAGQSPDYLYIGCSDGSIRAHLLLSHLYVSKTRNHSYLQSNFSFFFVN